MNLAAEAFYSPRLESGLLMAYKRTLASPLKKRIRSLNRRLGKIEADRKRMEDFLGLQEDGELIKANLYRIKKGMEGIELPDWNTGQNRTVKLTPSLDGVANMERIFKKAAKGKRGRDRIRTRMNETLQEKQALEDLLYFVEESRDVDELNRLAEETPISEPQTKSQKTRKTKSKEKAPTPMFREFRAPSGRPVLVGRSGRGNDFLLRRKAKRGDLWFHVKDMAGAHVLLPQKDKNPPTAEDKEFASALAAYFSRARDKGQVDVIMADVKDVGRPKGAAPGLAHVKAYSVLRAESRLPPEESV
jgi:predicted ribosome quality control (RQC) complex YloA/Tae2 family protein